MARLSYFGEKRHQNNDPNFFNRIPIDEIRKNVKRIIRDIKFDNIEEGDYNYFFSTQIIQACIIEAEENYKRCSVDERALRYYINYLYSVYANQDIIDERIEASNEHANQNARALTWRNILYVFRNISSDPNLTQASIMQYLAPIRAIDNRIIQIL